MPLQDVSTTQRAGRLGPARLELGRLEMGRLEMGRPGDPRSLQLLFSALVLLDLLVRLVVGSSVEGWLLRVGLPLLVVLGSVLVLPWARLPRGWAAAVPVVDIALIGFLRLDDTGSGIEVLMVPCAFFLGHHFGRRGVGLTAGACLALVVAPDLVVGVGDASFVGRTVLSSVVAVLGAAGIAWVIGELEQARRVSDAIVDSVPVGLVLTDHDGRYRAMNQAQEQIMALAFPDGQAAQEAKSGVVWAADGTTPLPRHEWPSERVTRGEQFDDVRVWVGDDPLTRRALSVSARVVRDEHEAVLGASMACHDITDFVRALRVKDEFVSSVSHELRTPLTSINGYAQMLLERDGLADDVRRQLTVITRNSDRLHRLVGDLLDSAVLDPARPGQGTAVLVRRPEDLVALVRHCVESADPVAAAAGVTLTMLPTGAADVDAVVDAHRLTQVIDNLLSNAVKFTPAGGCVEVGVECDGDRVEITVSDTGVGLTHADREGLFTRFYRSSHAHEQAIPGAGLGLSIARGIVLAHGGRILVESEPGEGTTFRVRLPLGQPVTVSADAETAVG